MKLAYVGPASLGRRERDEIWRFFSRFVRRDRATFEAKLDSVDEVILVRDHAGAVNAFGAVEVVTSWFGNEPHGLLVTHWAALDPSLRGRNVIQRFGLRCYVKYRLANPTHRVYWVFGASTYKSYLLLTRNCRDYWPRHDGDWPTRERALVADLMRQSPDPGWDPDAGVIRRFGVSRYMEGVVDDDPAVLCDSDIRYYASRNPHQNDGDTLLCICSLTTENWMHIMRTAARRRARRTSGHAGLIARWGVRTFVTNARDPLSLPPPPP